MEYTPELDWLVYLAIKNDQMGIGPVIWDVPSKKILWQSTFQGFEVEEPAWSPVDNQVAVIAGDRIFIISRTGDARQVVDNSQDSYLSDLAWSPDGRYIAFRSTPKSNSKERLLIYDTKLDLTPDYCIVSDQVYSSPAEWFPNSRQLQVTLWKRLANGDVGDLNILVDIEKNAAYKLK